MLEKIEVKRRRGLQMVGCHTDVVDMNLSKLWEIVKDVEDCHVAIHGITKSHTRLSN